MIVLILFKQFKGEMQYNLLYSKELGYFMNVVTDHLFLNFSYSFLIYDQTHKISYSPNLILCNQISFIKKLKAT